MRNFFCVFIIAVLLVGAYRCGAQNYPVYSSYYVNPYLYNPAEAATDFTYVFINHRRQWMGVEGAPVLTTVNFNTLINETHAGIGAKISSYKRGILNTTDLSLSYAYGVALNKKSTLYFGLSGGAISNTVELTDNVTPDPALANYQANNIQPTANFGMLYRSASGLNFGIALPQLFAPAFTGSTFSSTDVTPFDNAIVSAYYRKRVEGKIVSRKRRGVRSRVKTNDANAPLELYAMYKYAKAGNSQFEVLAKLNLSENFWLGGSYKQGYGFSAITGISVKSFMLSYAYELPGQPEPGFSQGTHEIQVGLRLGKQKKFKRVAPVLRSTITGNKDAQHTARFQQTVEDADRLETDKGGSRKKYYVIVKAFSDFTGADAFKKKLIADKFNADIFYYAKDKKYYVHVLETSKSSDAYEEARNLKNYTKLKTATVLTVEVPKQ